MSNRSDLRRRLRAARRALSGRRRRRAEVLISRRVQRLAAYRRARTVAAYLAFDGEVDVAAVMENVLVSGKTLALPVLMRRRGSTMRLCVLRPGDRIRRNRFGIWEPATPRGTRVAPGRVDLLLVPLVGFDASGTRLGMGGGYYDRYLAAGGRRRGSLVGVAFECQKRDRIDRRAWDVPMSAIVTEERTYRNTAGDRQWPDRIEEQA